MSINNKDYIKEYSKKGVLGPMNLATYVALSYAILFVALRVVLEKNITVDSLVLPAVALYLIITVAKHVLFKTKAEIPQWFVLSAFIVANVAAIAMTFIL